MKTWRPLKIRSFYFQDFSKQCFSPFSVSQLTPTTNKTLIPKSFFLFKYINFFGIDELSSRSCGYTFGRIGSNYGKFDGNNPVWFCNKSYSSARTKQWRRLFTVLDWVKGKTYKPTNIRKLHGELTILIFCKTELCYDQFFADRLLYKAFLQCINLSRTMPICRKCITQSDGVSWRTKFDSSWCYGRNFRVDNA